MENNVKEKNNSKGVIVLLCIIIVILLAVCTLFATGTISLNNKQTSNEQTDNGTTKEEENTANKLTEEEAVSILKNTFTDKTVQYLVNFTSVTYCNKDYTESVSAKDLGLDYEWNGYNKCTDFNSYEELTNYLKQFVTEKYFNNVVLKNGYVVQTHTMPDGTVLYNYYEKDGNLYAASTGKGGDMRKYKLLDNETIYNINSFDNTNINATINAKWQDAGDGYYSELIKIVLVKEDGKWKVSSYEATEQ